MRRALVVLALLTATAGCTARTAPPATPPAAPTSAVVAPSPELLTMPDVVGQNAAVAVDKLKKLGYTNIDLGTVDGRPAVVLPQNWTVKKQSARAGDRLAADAKIVLGCARNG